jgi:hypothetical protein
VSSRNSKYETALPTAGQTLPVGHAAVFDQAWVPFPEAPAARIAVAFGALAVALATCDVVATATFVFAGTAPAATGLSKVQRAAWCPGTHGGVVTDPTVNDALADLVVSVAPTKRSSDVFR